MSASADPMPSPPFPATDSPVLWMIVQNAMSSYETGETDVRGAIIHAAVHGWYEGHAQGEDACPGCDFRGDLPKQKWKRDVDNRATWVSGKRQPELDT